MRGPIVAICALIVTPAWAGSLSKVVGGLGQATGSNARPAPPAQSSSGPQSSGVWVESETPSYPAGVVVGGDGRPVASPGPDVTLQLGFSLMAVHDSDGAVAFEVSFTHDDFGLAVRGRSFFEEQQTGSTLRMDLGSIVAQFRPIGDVWGDFWLEGGVGGVATIDDIHAYGALAGVRLERRLYKEIAARAAARYYVLSDDIRLLELSAGVRLAWIEFAYRLFDFNVGPPLHGPEVGLSLRF